MRSISWIFFTVVFLCTTLWLLFDRWHQPAPEPLPPQVVARQDSISKANDEIQKQLIDNQVELQKQKDSALKKLDDVERALKRAEDNTKALAGRIRLGSKKDTVKIIEDCNELVDTAVALAERSEAYRKANDSLKILNDKVQENAQQQISSLQAFNSDMRNNFKELNNAYQSQSQQLKKEQRKADKKYTIGLGVGGGLTNEGKPAAMVGVFITKTIFRL